MSYNIPACIMRDCLSPESSFLRRKIHIMYAEVQRQVTMEVLWISIYAHPISSVSVPHMRQYERWYEARKIRYLVGETCSGQDVGPRGETSALLSRFSLSLLYPIPSSRRPSSLCSSLFPIYRLRELPESRDANLTCTTTNEEQEERDLNIFESMRCHLVCSQRLSPRCIHMYFAFEYTHENMRWNRLAIKNNFSTFLRKLFLLLNI